MHDRVSTIGEFGFAGFAIASFGAPLALAALIAPSVLGDAAGSAGFSTLSAIVVFAVYGVVAALQQSSS
jgi:hypothetical protein